MEILKYWTSDDFEFSSYGWRRKNRINQQFKKWGGDESGMCIYTYNELGFRGCGIAEEGFKIMCIGDSITEGVGVNDNETWPYQFSQLIPNSVHINFGLSGGSNDYILRVLFAYYDLIKPDLVLIMYTHPLRREVYTKIVGIHPFNPTNDNKGYMMNNEEGREIEMYKTLLQNDNEDFINWYKNHLLISNFLENKKSNWLWNGWFDIPTTYTEYNRFDGGFGRFVDRGADNHHPGLEHYKTYSLKLYNFIYKNFREYLPKDCNQLQKYII
jgi:lysophospholipase L1-like esterase